MRSETFGAAIIVLFIAAVTAPAASAASDDACKLLTPAQASSAIGASVGAGEHVTPTFVKVCTWKTAAGANYQFVTLSLQAAGVFASSKTMLSHVKNVVVTPVRGLGDDAFYLATGDNVGLNVKKGDVAFKVEVYAHGPVAKKEAMEKPLASEVVSKL